ncbi:HAMP domain-containing histidine kinase [Bradyrhizobium sp. UFLA 03-164]|uniref:histidine kinase n=1 Tax=Bradyrhizobium uaiense TaxID=2594946 RepID=A0A6P1BW81_9BRAD|nr:HAMP domain-containing histidine kinase [Bradyrhizobium uaiense]
MTSIARTLTLSLGMAAAVIFFAAVGLVFWLFIAQEPERSACFAAAYVLGRATEVNPGDRLTVRPTARLEELKSQSPDLWYVVAYGDVTSEFGRERRPPLPVSLPFVGPSGLSMLKSLDQNSSFCMVVMHTGHVPELVMMIGNAHVRPDQIAMWFILKNLLEISLYAAGYVLIVAIGVFLAARFVARSIERVTKLALAIDPAAPQGSISLDRVPAELKPLATALNRAFDEIHAYIRTQRRFLGNAAHQLRTPLTLLRARVEDVDDPALRVELIHDVRRLTSLVSAMLDLARLQNGTLEKRPIDLATVTRDVLADFSPSALDAGIELSLEHSDEPATMVQGVEAAIRSALANLVGNALIHARGARCIRASLSRGRVSISDDGAGLSPGSECKLIEPFQTGGTTRNSAGLGLSIVQEIMASHGGDLVIASNRGQGTTACLRFPEAASAMPIQRAAELT